MIRLVLIALVLGLAGSYVIWSLEKRRLERVAQLRAAFLALPPGEAGPQAARKDVHLRNATVRLRVPEAWGEEYPDAASARFSDRSGSRRRLEVAGTTMAAPTSLADALRTRASGASTLETLPSGALLVKCVSAARDGDADFVRFTWLVGRPLPAERAAVATFTLSVPFATAHDVLTRTEVMACEHEVRAAEVGPAVS
jgi:hypothetical protein